MKRGNYLIWKMIKRVHIEKMIQYRFWKRREYKQHKIIKNGNTENVILSLFSCLIYLMMGLNRSRRRVPWKHHWSNGMITASHAVDPGSTPGWRIFLRFFIWDKRRKIKLHTREMHQIWISLFLIWTNLDWAKIQNC